MVTLLIIPGGYTYMFNLISFVFSNRTHQERIDAAVHLLDLKATGQAAGVEHIKGVTAVPVLEKVKNFDCTWGEVTDLLHSAHEGLGKDIARRVVKTKQHPFSLAKVNETLEPFDKFLLNNCSNFTEMERFLSPFSKFNKWFAYDFHIFFTYVCGPLCADPESCCPEYWEMMRNFADAVYWLSYSAVTEVTKQAARTSVEKFSEQFLKQFGPRGATHKFHTFQHLPNQLENHGACDQVDAFFGEEHLGFLKKSITTTRLPVDQLATKFLVAHHATCFKKLDDFIPDSKKLLRRFNATGDSVLTSWRTHTFKTRTKTSTNAEHHRMLLCTFIFKHSKLNVAKNELIQCTRIQFFNRVFTSKLFQARGRRKDCFVSVYGITSGVLGQIKDIYRLACPNNIDSARYFCILQKYTTYQIYDKEQKPLVFPVNQFPVLEGEDGDIEVLEFHPRNIFLKACLINRVFKCDPNRSHAILSVQASTEFLR